MRINTKKKNNTENIYKDLGIWLHLLPCRDIEVCLKPSSEAPVRKKKTSLPSITLLSLYFCLSYFSPLLSLSHAHAQQPHQHTQHTEYMQHTQHTPYIRHYNKKNQRAGRKKNSTVSSHRV